MSSANHRKINTDEVLDTILVCMFMVSVRPCMYVYACVCGCAYAYDFDTFDIGLVDGLGSFILLCSLILSDVSFL